MDKVLILSVLVGISALLSGCGGVSGSHSVSPASVLLPGLVQKLPETPGEKYVSKTPIAPVETDLTVCDQVISEDQRETNLSL